MEFVRGPSATTWLLATLVVGVPLCFDPFGFAPFGPAKWVVFATLGALTGVGLLVRRCGTVPFGWGWGWVIFLAWGAVVSVAAVDPVHTWIGTPDRRLGWFAWLLFGVVFVAAVSTADAGRNRLLKAAVVALAGIGIYVLLELIGLAPVELSVSGDRPGGPFGTPAYVGAATALLIPVAVGAAADGLGSRMWRRFAVASAFVGTVASLASQTRAGWVGLAVAGAVAAPALRGWIVRKRLLVGAGATVLVVIIVASPVADRLASGVDFESGGARGRIDEWAVGAIVLSGHPVSGLGFEGYRIGFAEGVDATYEQRYGRAFVPDRAHSGVLDVGVTTGLLGGAVYVIAMGALVAASVRAARTRIPWLVGVGAGVAGYAAQQQFLFPIIEVDGVFWVFAGMLVSATSRSLREVVTPRGAWLPTLVVVGAVFTAGVLDIAADHATKNAIDLERAGRASEAVARSGDALALRPDSIRYAFVAAGIANRTGTADGLAQAVERIEGGLDVSPLDPVLRAARAGYLVDLAVAQQDRAGLAAATLAWEDLVADDPNNAQFRLELGIAYAFGGENDAAEAAWLAAAELAPISAAPWANLVVLYLDGADLQAAEAAFAELVIREPDSSLIAPLRDRIDAFERENG